MRIVVDLQGAQGANSRRGVGRYSVAITKAIAAGRGQHEVLVALNGLLPDSVRGIRSAFEGLLPQACIQVWQAPGPVFHLDSSNDWRRRAAELTREAFLASLAPDVVVVTSLFEGLRDDAATSIARLSRSVPTAVILYDLIPLIYRWPYLENPSVESWYEDKLEHLRRADLLLAISESSRQEAIRYLGFPLSATSNISAAVDPRFQPQHVDPGREADLRARYGLSRAFVMYTGGIDHRKNIEGLIRAYAMLPSSLRAQHQLVIVCDVESSGREQLEALAKKRGLDADEVRLTGFVPEEELLGLYNLCKAFVFPSLHEGFGLPALEAMSCGRAVIGSNTSSIPEVIGEEEAQFNPMSDASIRDKLEKVLVDEHFRSALERHGLERAHGFSWEASAQRAIAALESWRASRTPPSLSLALPPCRPKLAYVSPLPPQRSGISDYSAEVLPELARHYDIEVIVDQEEVINPWITANCPVRSQDWFKTHAERFDRVMFHFGNSEFHKHMFGLLEAVPGVVVLHDFFLSAIAAHMEFTGYARDAWIKELYNSHGFAAVEQWVQAGSPAEVIWRYPCNLSVLQGALGIVVHSEHSRRLAKHWYGSAQADDWFVVPLPRAPAVDVDSAAARHALKLDDGDFVVCSFGMLGPSKLNHRLLEAWLASELASDESCILLFVGESQGGDYESEMLARIRGSGLDRRVRITGWADSRVYRQHLAAADVGVQLRSLSRGETSAAVLDSLAYGLATIVNANGSMADIADDLVWKLPDEFSNAELVEALETLKRDQSRRMSLGARARTMVFDRHAPRSCADRYAEAIEASYLAATTGLPGLSRALVEVEPTPTDPRAWIRLAEDVAQSIRPGFAPRQLLVDISELVQLDAKSGIQRVVRSILRELLAHPPRELRVEPIYGTPDRGYRYARRYALGFLGSSQSTLTDTPVEFRSGDLFLGLDLNPHVVPAHKEFFRKMRRFGVKVRFVVYDILPIQLSWAFVEGAADLYGTWLQTVAESDGAICISKAVAGEVINWLRENLAPGSTSCAVGWFPLGVDIDSVVPSRGIPHNAETVLGRLASQTSFLMVGTLEPRKAHAQVLAAFEVLWAGGIEANLVIAGKIGWMVEGLVSKLRAHPELGNRLIWLEGISDEHLTKVYEASSALVAASEGEGFGLPLLEAARYGIPLIARDLPVFREVAGDNAHYFSGTDPGQLAASIRDWLKLHAEGMAPRPRNVESLTWAESSRTLAEMLCNDSSPNWLSVGQGD